MTEATVRPRLHESWLSRLGECFESGWFRELKIFLEAERAAGAAIYPPGSRIFAALDSTPFEQVRAVILGQDPYHGAGQAHGLCFSVPAGVPKPPSLVNIHQEWHSDLGLPIPSHGSLEPWARNGVLLLNTCLTVRAGQPLSHQGKGWERFTDRVIEILAQRPDPMVFILWGAPARKKTERVDLSRHGVITSPHPSPLSSYRGFFGSKPFSRANEFLKKAGRPEIDWSLPE